MTEPYRWEIASRIAQRRVVAIVRTHEAEEAEQLGAALIDAGLDVLEVSLTTRGAPRAIERLVARHPDALIGAGTVLDEASARIALLAGARFIVSPALSTEVVALAHRYGAAVLPGARTPTEVVAALSAGADLVKLFPADELQPASLQAIRAALPQAPLVPTGGIEAGNAAAWLRAGAVALGVAGWLTADPGRIAERAAELLAAVRADAKG